MKTGLIIRNNAAEHVHRRQPVRKTAGPGTDPGGSLFKKKLQETAADVKTGRTEHMNSGASDPAQLTAFVHMMQIQTDRMLFTAVDDGESVIAPLSNPAGAFGALTSTVREASKFQQVPFTPAPPANGAAVFGQEKASDEGGPGRASGTRNARTFAGSGAVPPEANASAPASDGASMEPIAGDFEAIVQDAAAHHGLDPGLIRAVIRAESGFDPAAESPKGACGLMQLMPSTARELGVQDPFDARQNIMGGSRYLKTLLDRYNGDLDQALAAYNWGMGNVEKNPGRLPAETRTYLTRVKQYYSETSPRRSESFVSVSHTAKT